MAEPSWSSGPSTPEKTVRVRPQHTDGEHGHNTQNRGHQDPRDRNGAQDNRYMMKEMVIIINTLLIGPTRNPRTTLGHHKMDGKDPTIGRITGSLRTGITVGTNHLMIRENTEDHHKNIGITGNQHTNTGTTGHHHMNNMEEEVQLRNMEMEKEEVNNRETIAKMSEAQYLPTIITPY